jgi:XTP/dITP diphosphohydrolase
MEKLLLATNNQGKIEEYRFLLKGIPYELVTPAEISLKMAVEESGATYEENARLKAEVLAAASGLLTLADDSGLEVDALNGEPGTRSSRYAGEAASDAARVAFLLAKLKDVPREKRTARFRCVIAITMPDGQTVFYSGSCEGLITLEPRGQAGFGYDPIFYFPDLKKTMAELPAEVKNTISHRAHAAQAACKTLTGTSKGHVILERDVIPGPILDRGEESGGVN